MKKIAIVLAAATVLSLGACKKTETTTVENTAETINTDLSNNAAALDNQVNADTNAAAGAATNEATSLQSKTDSIRSEATKTTTNTTTTK